MLDRRRRNGMRQRGGRTPSLNITPFMNLMVVLVPFLLSGIVFCRLAVLELTLPTTQAENAPILEDKEPFRLIVTLRKHELSVSASGIGLVEFPARQDKSYDFDRFAAVLRKVKQGYPKEASATLLSEGDITYESLVSVMDQLRENEQEMLFPDISIGEVRTKREVKPT